MTRSPQGTEQQQTSDKINMHAAELRRIGCPTDIVQLTKPRGVLRRCAAHTPQDLPH
ncbi:hypothetical protein ACFY3M_15825 [Streptomyces mirabilis]|uniref:hypothetical protein n=1 Tax=Streptomyces mirabilis TaxID=68239 RepID=UPI0036CAD271